MGYGGHSPHAPRMPSAPCSDARAGGQGIYRLHRTRHRPASTGRRPRSTSAQPVTCSAGHPFSPSSVQPVFRSARLPFSLDCRRAPSFAACARCRHSRRVARSDFGPSRGVARAAGSGVRGDPGRSGGHVDAGRCSQRAVCSFACHPGCGARRHYVGRRSTVDHPRETAHHLAADRMSSLMLRLGTRVTSAGSARR